MRCSRLTVAAEFLEIRPGQLVGLAMSGEEQAAGDVAGFGDAFPDQAHDGAGFVHAGVAAGLEVLAEAVRRPWRSR